MSMTSDTPSSVLPTTAMPMTEPPLKPVRNEGRIPVCAASAVFTLAIVATRMPMTPAMAENTVPQI